MTRWPRGLVIGKFRPPHNGHGLLIDTALAHVDELTIIVCGDVTDSIPRELRAGWLRELYPAADVRDFETTGYDPEDSFLWADLTRAWLGKAPDVVLTSESYGEAYARALGCVHVPVDPERTRARVSGSQILAAPFAHLDFLQPCVRAHFVPRVVMVGAESTGKTTLARALANHFRTVWVPEYGRLFCEGMLPLGYTWDTPDFVHIADAQRRLEDQLARKASRVIICDTDAFATWLWHARYLGTDSPAVRAIAESHRPHLYLLPRDDIDWEEDDGTRDRREERHSFYKRFRIELERWRLPYVALDGSFDERLVRSVEAVDSLLRGDDPTAPAHHRG